MKIIVGFFTTKPGQRENYLRVAAEHLKLSRLEPGCHYIELVPMPDHPDKILLAEAFVSEEAHREHEDTDHMRQLWAEGEPLLAHVVIDNVISASVDHHEETFD